MGELPANERTEPREPMARALELARAAKGRTSPNPAVGAVIVREGRIVAEGATQPGGRPHAETVALAAAGPAARGATMYVTLEPCAHYGRTPPCADAIIAAGMAEVHVATLDPDPRVAGRGVGRLRAAGIVVTIGERAAEARDLNEDFARWVTTGRPLVIAKFAASLDGHSATRTGDSRWITDQAARLEVHRLRDRVDGILAGIGTILRDDPQLTTRLPEAERPVHHPQRFVLDSLARTPPSARILSRETPGTTTILATERAPESRRAALEAAGAEVLVLPAGSDGRVSLPDALDALGRREITSLLVEGGPTVHGAFLDQHLVDRIEAFIAPLIIGDRAAPLAVAGAGAETLAQATRLLDVQSRRLGPDTLISGYVRRVVWPEPPTGER
jgi:diaminohydroxyphosphoribosylaminopyrimidine deaminase/5-amino-6-(5-phosphoribosylamino)uracil reductase